MLSEGTTKEKKQQRLDSYKPRRSGVRAWGWQVQAGKREDEEDQG